MKYLLILLLLGCATKSEVRKLEGDLKMLNSINQKLLESKERTFGYTPKPLPVYGENLSSPPVPPPAEVYIFTNANSRMQADPEWLKTVKGVDYWADRESVRRMRLRQEGTEMILRGAHIIEENR